MLKKWICRACLVILAAMFCPIVWLAPPFATAAAETKSKSSESALWDESTAAEEGKEKKSPFQLTGMIRDKFGFDLRENDPVEDDFSNHAKLRIGAKYVPHDRFHMLLSAEADYLQYQNGGDWDYDSTVRLHNAYINWNNSLFNLKVGNQILRWGKTDGYSPLDNLNPEDYRDGVAGRREDRKIPIPMVNLELYRGKFTLQGVYIPAFMKPTLDTVGTDWSLFQHADEETGFYRIEVEDPAANFRNSEVGVRFAGIVRHVNFAFSWFQTREDLPVPDSLSLPPGFRLPPGELRMTDLLIFGQLTRQTVFLKHERQNIYGFEFESTLGDFGIRGDLVYFDQTSYLTRDLKRVRKPVGQAMLGLDYNGPNGWYANVQYFQSAMFNYDDNILWAKEYVSAINGTVSKEFFNGRLKPECRFYYDFSGNASMLNPKLIISYWEPIIFEIGAELFDGSEETPLGIFGENDLVYFQLEANF